jgi:N-acetylmuramoyl-L-alanine amidase
MADTPEDRLPPEVRAAAEGALAGRAVRLRGGALDGGRLTLDFSGELRALGLGSREFERWSRELHRAVAEPLRERLERLEVFTTVEGVPLHELLPAPAAVRATEPRRAAAAGTAAVGEPGRAALALRRIAVSPGHGYYLLGSSYVLQRAYWQGIVEDFVNHDMVTLLAEQLTAAGAEVRSTRNLDRNAGVGETGFPKWQEAARYHVKALGADPSVWNEAGFTHLEQDIRCRPRYANAINADVLVSIHNNGAGTPGAGTGTETLYDTNNGFGPESRRLADLLHARVIAAIRRDYNPAWVDRRVQGFNGSYGENRLATRPAVIMEIAFMDRPTPDNAALQDERFKRLVATAIREGLEEFLEGAAAPAAPTALVAGGVAGGVVLGWRDRSDNEAGFRIERRAATGTTWALVATAPANTVSFKDATAPAGVAQVYRVTAVNARGVSGVSNETTGVAEAAGASPTAWLANVSLRTTLAGGQTVIVGLAVAGGGKEVLVRAAGPGLRQFGVENVLAAPRMELFRGAGSVAANAGWEAAGAATMARVGAFPFAAGSADAALVRSLEGAHSVQVTGAGPGGGAVLVEAYDAGSGSVPRLVNLSARNRVGTGADVLIAGLTVGGRGAQRLLVRAVGPGLTAFGVGGVLADPRLELFDARGGRVTENDNWDVALAPVFAGLGAFALTPGSRDAAVVVTLPVGGYTAQVSGVASGTGEGLVEVYELP